MIKQWVKYMFHFVWMSDLEWCQVGLVSLLHSFLYLHFVISNPFFLNCYSAIMGFSLIKLIHCSFSFFLFYPPKPLPIYHPMFLALAVIIVSVCKFVTSDIRILSEG